MEEPEEAAEEVEVEAVAPGPPPMMPAFAIPPRPAAKVVAIAVPGTFTATPLDNSKAPVGKVKVRVPTPWNETLMYPKAKLSIYVPPLAKAVASVLPATQADAVEVTLTLDDAVGTMPFAVGPISITSGPKPSTVAPVVPVRRQSSRPSRERRRRRRRRRRQRRR